MTQQFPVHFEHSCPGCAARLVLQFEEDAPGQRLSGLMNWAARDTETAYVGPEGRHHCRRCHSQVDACPGDRKTPPGNAEQRTLRA